MTRSNKRCRRDASSATSTEPHKGSFTFTPMLQSSFLFKKSCLTIIFLSASNLPSAHAYSADDGPTTVEAFFGYFLIVIGVLSLLGWGYIFYLRHKYSQRIKEEEEQIQRAKKCCQINCSGASPIALHTPPRSRSSSREKAYDIESAQVQPREQYIRNQHPQHLQPRGRNRQHVEHQQRGTSRMSSSTYEPSMEESDEEDSFARDLQIAARADQHFWAEREGGQRAHALRQKKVPSLKPSKKDVEHIDASFGVFDSFFGGWKKDNVDLEKDFEVRSPPLSYLPEELQPPAQAHSNDRNKFNRGTPSQDRQHQLHIPMNSSDPSDVILSESSEESSSYAGRNSSVEEGEHEEDGFELVGYLKGKGDGMNEYLLNPIPAGDDASFGNSSGMEMSLGANTATTNQTESTLGRGSEGRGFYVIDNQNDVTHEYIPKEEYDAAVMAAAHVIKNSPRNSPRNSPLRSRSEAELHNTWLNQDGELATVPSAPSDERSSRHPPLMASTQDSSENYSVSIEESTSIDPGTVHTSLDSSTAESDPKLSRDIYNELRDVSAFIRNYEKKQSRKGSVDQWNSDGSMLDSSYDTSTFHSIGSQPSVTMTSTSEAESTSKDHKKKKFRKLSFGRNKKGPALQDEVSEVSVKVKRKKKSKKKNILPPRHPSQSHEQMDGELDQEDYDYDDDVIVMPNPYRPNEPRKQQLPVAVNNSYPGIGLSPSAESAASDAKFLHNEIASFFTQKDASMSVMSESIEVLHRPNDEKAKKKTSQKSPHAETENSEGAHDTTFESEFSGGLNPTVGQYNRLGAMPFNPKESYPVAAPFDRNMPSPPSTVRVRSPNRQKKFKSPTLASNRKDTPVYGQSVYSPPSQFTAKKEGEQAPLAHSARSILQTGAKSIASIIDRTRQSPKHDNGRLESSHNGEKIGIAQQRVQGENLKNTVAGLENKLQNGARSLMSMFEAKGSDETVASGPSTSVNSGTKNSKSSYDRKMNDRISNRLDQIRRNVKERASPKNSPKSSPKNHAEHTRGKTSLRNHELVNFFDADKERPRASKKVQVATFMSPEEIVSPSATSQIRERKPGRLLKAHVDVSQQSGDDTTESPSRANNSRTTRERVPLTVEAFSKRHDSSANSTTGSVSSNARNLISMFESKQSNVSGIFPPGEHWQYTGRLKSQRHVPSPRYNKPVN